MSKQIIEAYGQHILLSSITTKIADKIKEGYTVEQLAVTSTQPGTTPLYTAFVIYRAPETEIEPSPRINYAEEREKKTVEEKPKKKTYMEDFFEKFPNAPRDPNGEPRICPDKIYVGAKNVDAACDVGCVECWNREMEE